jgi:hypothetical protein
LQSRSRRQVASEAINNFWPPSARIIKNSHNFLQIVRTRSGNNNIRPSISPMPLYKDKSLGWLIRRNAMISRPYVTSPAAKITTTRK